jgi:hypothetical protein
MFGGCWRHFAIVVHMVARPDGQIAATLNYRKIPWGGAAVPKEKRRDHGGPIAPQYVSGRGGTVYSIKAIWQLSPFRVLAGGLIRRHVPGHAAIPRIRSKSLIPQMKSGVALEA